MFSNMKDKVVDFFLNNLAGRLIVRLSVSLAAYLASGAIGVHVSVDPAELQKWGLIGVNLLVTALKPRDSQLPAVETPKA